MQIGAVKGKGKKGQDVKGKSKGELNQAKKERCRPDAGREEQGLAVFLLPEERSHQERLQKGPAWNEKGEGVR